MLFKSPVTLLGTAAALAFAGVGTPGSAVAQTADKVGQVSDERIALNAALEKVAILEAELDRQRQANAALAESLAGANRESRAARTRLAEIQVELEALGVTALGGDDRDVSQRLLKALAAIESERVYRQALEERLVSLSEAITTFLPTVSESDLAARASLEVAMRSADSLLAGRSNGQSMGASDDEPISLTDSSVISLNPELGLAVLNVGKKSGVQIGMPFEIFRNDRILGAALVVDARDHICGLAFGGSANGLSEVKVGDRARPRIGQ
ncbi:hypothetical protein [Sulfuriroseicoccus oceanibius]|uniref:Uncharacterized protein n=1 Tax=Sulfuriroseicoccus oceanibius TaxID=2707525 RepID=A0A6B3L8T2_9BACT|nr:hypothetical protein [Sulfuriroseicoccus oceanibius]QQL45825.1 hypothetical protein G3M56_004370 [Sulfuriroseicoccus oceanibius]